MCGIVGILGTSPVNLRIYDALTVLQHRGQDAAGIATTAGARIYLRKDNGLVKRRIQNASYAQAYRTNGNRACEVSHSR